MISNRKIGQQENMSVELFLKLCKFIGDEYGIILKEKKKDLVEQRIIKRSKELGIQTINDYLNFIFSKDGLNEKEKLGEVFSTNKTYFFRELEHFDFISKLIFDTKSNIFLNIWCAGCSSGEEVFTLAMVLNESRRENGLKTLYTIWGTDISMKSLKTAEKRIYNENQLWCTPDLYKNKYFKKIESSKGPYFEVDKALLKNVNFSFFNLVKMPEDFSRKFDIIFCRNVIIYFNDLTKFHVINKLMKCLNTGGYLILSMTEGAIGKSLKLNQVGPSIFLKT